MSGHTENKDSEENDVVHTHPATGVQKGCPACDALMSPLVDGFDIRTNAERERDALAARLADVEEGVKALADELRGMPPYEGLEAVSTAWVVGRLRAVLGSDAHTEQEWTPGHEFNFQTGFCACGWAGPAIDKVSEAHAAHIAAVLGSDAHTEQKGAGEWRCDHTQHDTARCVPTKHYAKDDTQ